MSQSAAALFALIGKEARYTSGDRYRWGCVACASQRGSIQQPTKFYIRRSQGLEPLFHLTKQG
jgi:hypothetical protein